ncbi:CoA ester lyase [Egicoccus sp. AB-alg2]|uniref:HpcH/HpaI aldolase/citrate lyase family protein n=1 Tax=Egicoccus sp. AB-alg2 TaxID=3242693 RepID=UPI00359E74A9
MRRTPTRCSCRIWGWTRSWSPNSGSVALSRDHRLHRSYLYAPGSNPDVMRKALRAGADAVILDLEDAVAPSAKEGARAAVADLLDEIAGQDTACDVHVRVNAGPDGVDVDDLAAVVRPALRAVRIPKVESAAAIRELAATLDDLEARAGLPVGDVGIYPTIESAAAVVALAEICGASARIVRCALGSSDLLADLAASGDDDTATLYARSALVVHSRAAGIGPPVDSVHTDLQDEPGLKRSAQRGRSLGFHGKSVIHPRQLPAVHEVFTPGGGEVAAAREIVAAADAADRAGVGATRIGAAFVDPAIVARARALLGLVDTEQD